MHDSFTVYASKTKHINQVNYIVAKVNEVRRMKVLISMILLMVGVSSNVNGASINSSQHVIDSIRAEGEPFGIFHLSFATQI